MGSHDNLDSARINLAQLRSIRIPPPHQPLSGAQIKPLYRILLTHRRDCGLLSKVPQLVSPTERAHDHFLNTFSDIYSEVWSYSFDNSTNEFSVADLASLSPDGTESDAIQLWSYGFLGLLNPTMNNTNSTSSGNTTTGMSLTGLV